MWAEAGWMVYSNSVLCFLLSCKVKHYFRQFESRLAGTEMINDKGYGKDIDSTCCTSRVSVLICELDPIIMYLKEFVWEPTFEVL